MKILVTGFTPFRGETINPSYEVVKALSDNICSATIVKAQLQTQFGESYAQLSNLISLHKPDCIVSIGQAGGRNCVSIEKVAINYAVTAEADPDKTIINNTIIEGAPVAYFSTLPCEEIVENIKAEKIPCNLSLSAGAFVCNYIMYMALYNGGAKKVGFIHIPFVPEQTQNKDVGTHSLPLAQSVKAVEIALKTIINNR